MEFSMDQVDLTQVGLARVTRYPRAMFDRLAEMCIALHTQPGEESDALLVRLGKGVHRAAAHSHHSSTHRLVLPSQRWCIKLCRLSEKKRGARTCSFFSSLPQSLVVILVQMPLAGLEWPPSL